MGTIKEGARNAVKTMEIKKSESVLIITDRETFPIAKELRASVSRITDKIFLFVMEDFGKRPLKDIPEEIKDAIKVTDVYYYLAQASRNLKRTELKKFIRPLRLLAHQNNIRYAHMPNISKEIMETGMCTDFRKLFRFTMKILDIVSKAKEIRVKTYAGTNLTATFSKKYKWVSLTGWNTKPGKWTNLPGDEIFTYPESVKGVAVIDGSIGNYFSKYGLMDKTPVRIDIDNGVVRTVSCNNKTLENDLKSYLKTDTNASRIGEFAFGTNTLLKYLIGRNLQDEKFPGVHIATGNAYREMTNAPYSSKAHVDFVMRNCNVWVDGQKIMQKGKYLI